MNIFVHKNIPKFISKTLILCKHIRLLQFIVFRILNIQNHFLKSIWSTKNILFVETEHKRVSKLKLSLF